MNGAAQNWHAFLIGENTPNANGPNQQIVLQHLTEKLGISHRVHWHAPHDDLISAYDCCDVYAMCSDSETFGMVTIEALRELFLSLARIPEEHPNCSPMAPTVNCSLQAITSSWPGR